MKLWFPSDRLWIGGAWVEAPGTLALEDPSTGEAIGEIAAGDAEAVDAAVAAARAALVGRLGPGDGGRAGARAGAAGRARRGAGGGAGADRGDGRGQAA